MRGVSARVYVYSLREAQEMVRQKRKREERERRMLEIRKNLCARKLQRAARNFLQRLAYNRDMETEKKQTAIKLIQKVWRGKLARLRFQRQKANAVILQSFLRTVLQIKKMRREKQAARVRAICEGMRKEKALGKAREGGLRWLARTRLRILEREKARVQELEREVGCLEGEKVDLEGELKDMRAVVTGKDEEVRLGNSLLSTSKKQERERVGKGHIENSFYWCVSV